MELLKTGLHPAASDALRQLGLPAWRIGQVIGTAKASAGTHEPDGHVEIHGQSVLYTCATDFHIGDLSGEPLRRFLDRLGGGGFAAWFRDPGLDHWPAGQARHVHAVWAGAPMKLALRDQIHDWLHGKNGLASHAPYAFWQPTEEEQRVVRALFLAHNPTNG